jgi:hypothetical protein
MTHKERLFYRALRFYIVYVINRPLWITYSVLVMDPCNDLYSQCLFHKVQQYYVQYVTFRPWNEMAGHCMLLQLQAGNTDW